MEKASLSICDLWHFELHNVVLAYFNVNLNISDIDYKYRYANTRIGFINQASNMNAYLFIYNKCVTWFF